MKMIIEANLAWVKQNDGVCEITYSTDALWGDRWRSPNTCLGKLILDPKIVCGEILTLRGKVPKSQKPSEILDKGEYTYESNRCQYTFRSNPHLLFEDQETQQKVLDKLWVWKNDHGYREEKKRLFKANVPEFWWIKNDLCLVRDQGVLAKEDLVVADNYLVRNIKVT
jgi:hypothetical protein